MKTIDNIPFISKYLILLIGLVTIFIIFKYISKYKTRKHINVDKVKRDDRISATLFANEAILSSNDYSIIEDNLKLFLNICTKTKLYIFVKIKDEVEIDIVTRNFEDCGAFTNGLARHRLLFCTSDNGRISMIQQLQPYIHVEANIENVKFVSKKLPKLNVTTFENMNNILNPI